MAISYPLSYPTKPGFSQIDLTARFTVGVSVSPYTAQQQVYEWPANWWEAKCSLPPMRQSNAEDWITFLLSLHGMLGTFLLGDPSHPSPLGNWGGSPVCMATASGSHALGIRSGPPSRTGLLVNGDYVQVTVSGAQRIYKILTDVNTDSSGNAYADVFPSIREAIPDGTAIVVTNCKGLFRLKSNSVDWTVDKAKLFGIAFEAMEAL